MLAGIASDSAASLAMHVATKGLAWHRYMTAATKEISLLIGSILIAWRWGVIMLKNGIGQSDIAHNSYDRFSPRTVRCSPNTAATLKIVEVTQINLRHRSGCSHAQIEISFGVWSNLNGSERLLLHKLPSGPNEIFFPLGTQRMLSSSMLVSDQKIKPFSGYTDNSLLS